MGEYQKCLPGVTLKNRGIPMGTPRGVRRGLGATCIAAGAHRGCIAGCMGVIWVVPRLQRRLTALCTQCHCQCIGAHAALSLAMLVSAHPHGGSSPRGIPFARWRDDWEGSPKTAKPPVGTHAWRVAAPDGCRQGHPDEHPRCLCLEASGLHVAGAGPHPSPCAAR